MATIQVREIPEDAYEVLRRRAREAGQSIQGYMREQIVALAARPTKGEAVKTIEDVLARSASADPDPASVVDDVAAERR